LRSLQEIQPDFEEEAKAYAGLWSQGKKERVIMYVLTMLGRTNQDQMFIIYLFPEKRKGKD